MVPIKQRLVPVKQNNAVGLHPRKVSVLVYFDQTISRFFVDFQFICCLHPIWTYRRRLSVINIGNFLFKGLISIKCIGVNSNPAAHFVEDGNALRVLYISAVQVVLAHAHVVGHTWLVASLGAAFYSRADGLLPAFLKLSYPGKCSIAVTHFIFVSGYAVE